MYQCFAAVDCGAGEVCDPADGDDSTPGLCAAANDAGAIIQCLPGTTITCDCMGDAGVGVQVCNPGGTGYESCKSYDGNGPVDAPAM